MRRATVGVLVLGTLLLSSCAGRSFVRAEGITIVAPIPDDPVAQPVTLSWDIDAEIRERLDGRQIIFGVFVDRAPLAPGQNVASLVDDDCRQVAGCPDVDWLADRGVYLTEGTALEIRGLGDRRSSGSANAADVHAAVIVLLDRNGTRLGESWWAGTFEVDRGRR